MAEAHILGNQGEDIAADYLKKAGYKILYRNWHWGRHEIDIIAEKDDIVAFVEVKTRSEDFLVDLRDVISREKQKSIISAADGYLQRFRIDKESRFDVLTVIRKANAFEVEHIPDAFYPTLR